MNRLTSFEKEKQVLWLSDYEDIVNEYDNGFGCDIDDILCGTDRRLAITEDFEITIRALKFLEEEEFDYEMEKVIKLKSSKLLDNRRLQKICNIFLDCKEKLPEAYEEVCYKERLTNYLYEMFTNEVPRYLSDEITLEGLSNCLKVREEGWIAKNKRDTEEREESERKKQELIERHKRGSVEDFLNDNHQICIKGKLSEDLYIVYESAFDKDSSNVFEKEFIDSKGESHKFYYRSQSYPTFSRDHFYDNMDYTSLLVREDEVWSIKHHFSKFSILGNILYIHNDDYYAKSNIYLFNSEKYVKLSDYLDVYKDNFGMILSDKNRSLIVTTKYSEFKARIKIEDGKSKYCGEDFSKIFFTENFFNLQEIEKIK